MLLYAIPIYTYCIHYYILLYYMYYTLYTIGNVFSTIQRLKILYALIREPEDEYGLDLSLTKLTEPPKVYTYDSIVYYYIMYSCVICYIVRIAYCCVVYRVIYSIHYTSFIHTTPITINRYPYRLL